MVTHAQNIADNAQSYSIIVMIDGVSMYLTSGEITAANSETRIRFCTVKPDYASSQKAELWRDYIVSAPAVFGEQVDLQGGIPTLSAVTFSILDVDNYLTDLLRLDSTHTTYLNEALDASETGVDVSNATDIATNDVIWVGSECMLVTSKTSNTLTVTRGYANTDAVTHDLGDYVYSYPQFMRGRRCEVYVVPLNGTASEETLMGGYVIDGLMWDQALNSWQFSAKSELKYLHRSVPVVMSEPVTVTYAFNAGVRRENPYRAGWTTAYDYPVLIVESNEGLNWQHWLGSNSDHEYAFYAKINDEIVAARSNTLSTYAGNMQFRIYPSHRGLCGTSPESFEDGAIVKRVFATNNGTQNSFRYSPGTVSGTPSRSTTSPSWTATSHWLDLIMIIATSSSTSTDNITTNYNATYGCYATLPPGYGAGVPHTLIDWDAFEAVRDRTEDYKFNHFVFGDERVPFGEFIDQYILKPIGAYLTLVDGTVRVVLPRLPTSSSASVTIGHQNILTEMVGGQHLPRMEIKYGLDSTVDSLIYKVDHHGREIQVNAETPWKERANYQVDDRSVTIEAPGVAWKDRAFLRNSVIPTKVYRQHRPQLNIDVDVDMSLFSSKPGDLVKVSLTDAPSLSGGSRDWSSLLCEILGSQVSFEGDSAFIQKKLIGYASNLKIGKLCPSAYVTSVATNTATCTANRFTQADVSGGLPTTDAAAFAVGDELRLVNLDGTDVGGTTQTVNSISGNDITLDGNFGGNLAANKILTYADYSEASTDQKTDWAWCADQTAAVDDAVTTNVKAWVYGSD